MSSENIVYCEMCGCPIERTKARTVFVEGALLWVCSSCYAKITKSKTGSLTTQTKPTTKIVTPRLQLSKSGSMALPRREVQRSVIQRKTIYENFELVEDFAERIRRAREQKGWSTAILAEKVKESETTIKRIESGKLRPTIDLARRLEEVLGIKLLVPVIDEGFAPKREKVDKYATLGEVVAIKRKEG